MAKPRTSKYAISERKRNQRIKDGRGTGSLKNYKPWFYAQEVPTYGDRVEIPGLLTGRDHQFLSKNEENCFYIYEFCEGVTDIREQYPLLPLEETVEIAKQLGIKHPIDSATGALWVLTTDLLIFKDEEKYARTIKHDRTKWKLRMFELFEIERNYWLRRKVDWGIIERADIPFIVANNIRTIRSYYDLSTRLCNHDQNLDPEKLEVVSRALTQLLLTSDVPLIKVVSIVEYEFDLEAGTGLVIAYNLIATKRWKINLRKKLKPYEILDIEVVDKSLLAE